jgi:hypothetical protein
MASEPFPTAHLAAIQAFDHDTRSLDRRDWRLWTIAAFFLGMMFTTIASLAVEIERRGIEFLSGAQLDAAVRGLLVIVLLFTLFVIYQQAHICRMRRVAVEELRRELAGIPMRETDRSDS